MTTLQDCTSSLHVVPGKVQDRDANPMHSSTLSTGAVLQLRLSSANPVVEFCLFVFGGGQLHKMHSILKEAQSFCFEGKFFSFSPLLFSSALFRDLTGLELCQPAFNVCAS